MIATSRASGPLATPLTAGVSGTAEAALREVDDRTVSWFRVSGGPRAGALGEREGDVVERAVRIALDVGVPLVGDLATSGADVTEGVSALHAWGRVARTVARASGVVPVILGVRGPCVSGPALLLGLADHVVMTHGSFAYVSGIAAVASVTGVTIEHQELGGSGVHALRTGLASFVVDDDELEPAIGDLLSFLPDNSLQDPAAVPSPDPPERATGRAGAVVPSSSKASYDVRDVIADVVDDGSFFEVRARWAANIVTGFGRLAGQAVGVVANQPCVLAGVVDIAAAQKAARFVQHCDAFNVPLLTFVDTPGFQPGKDQEWRGMIRHGAQLVHAYAEATVARVCVVLRKAYGGAYIVMDSRGLGNDFCLAWPGAEVAVMGAPGAVGILHGRELAELPPEEAVDARRHLEDEYVRTFLSPWPAAGRGCVDVVVEPVHTRSTVTRAFRRLRTKREDRPWRRHSNVPL